MAVRSTLLIALAVLILGGFVIFMTTYTVNFTQAAVVTTFGKVDPESGVVDEPGIRLKWPVPIQSATVYDTRNRALQIRDETQQTRDQRQVVIGAFLTWRITDPLAFYQSFRGEGGSQVEEQYRVAEENLATVFRSAMSEVGRYTLDELLTPEGSALPALEGAIRDQLKRPRGEGGGEVGFYGIEVTLVGVKSLELPESVTDDVLAQMEADRARLASDTESRGEAEATAIRQKAQDDAAKIESFAQTLAAEIRAKGEREAAQYAQQFEQEPALAAFLTSLEFIDSLHERATLILETDFMGLGIFSIEGLRDFARPAGAGARTEATEATEGATR